MTDWCIIAEVIDDGDGVGEPFYAVDGGAVLNDFNYALAFPSHEAAEAYCWYPDGELIECHFMGADWLEDLHPEIIPMPQVSKIP